MKLNSDGFYYPSIDNKKCVDCGFCLQVCSFKEKKILNNNEPIKCWAAWSNDDDVRRKCSSGGIAFEIGKHLISQNYKVIGCRYDSIEQRAEHYISTTIKELAQTIGSKYIQSHTEKAFKQIDRKQKYLITGTPCQIDSIRRMIQKHHCEDNFVLLDFFCHGVPSILAWNLYRKMVESQIGKVTYASWRNKQIFETNAKKVIEKPDNKKAYPVDWHDSYNIQVISETGYLYQSLIKQGDLFYKLFLGDLCLGPQCQKECKYKKLHSSADIRIGDFWGRTYADDKRGVSAVIAFTKKGCDIVEHMKNVSLNEKPFDVVTEGQLNVNARKKLLSPFFMLLLKNNIDLNHFLFKSAIKAQYIVNTFSYRIKKCLTL